MSALFSKTPSPEPHTIRRRAILAKYPELKKLSGYSYVTTAIVVALVAAQLGIAYAFQHSHASFWLLLAVSYLVGGTFNHWLGMGMHEASHNLTAPTVFTNRLVALFANIPIPIPAAMPFRRDHLKHHSHLGVPVKDNDLAMDFEIGFVGRSRLRKVFWLTFYVFFATFARGFFEKKVEKWDWINVAWTSVCVVALCFVVGGTGMAYLGLSTFWGYSLLHPTAAHFIHEHYLWSPGQETYSYYGPLNWVTFNVGYHNEHHDLMNIPGWKLPIIKRTAPEFYDGLASHRSWIWVLGHFVMDRSIGHESRLTRSSPKGDKSDKEAAGALPGLLVTSEGKQLWKLPA